LSALEDRFRAHMPPFDAYTVANSGLSLEYFEKIGILYLHEVSNYCTSVCNCAYLIMRLTDISCWVYTFRNVSVSLLVKIDFSHEPPS
jgi:hypothetical protein